MSKSRAHRLIVAAEIAQAVPFGTAPSAKSQARGLAPLRNQPEQMAEAWTIAISVATLVLGLCRGSPQREAVRRFAGVS